MYAICYLGGAVSFSGISAAPEASGQALDVASPGLFRPPRAWCFGPLRHSSVWAPVAPSPVPVDGEFHPGAGSIYDDQIGSITLAMNCFVCCGHQFLIVKLAMVASMYVIPLGPFSICVIL